MNEASMFFPTMLTRQPANFADGPPGVSTLQTVTEEKDRVSKMKANPTFKHIPPTPSRWDKPPYAVSRFWLHR